MREGRREEGKRERGKEGKEQRRKGGKEERRKGRRKREGGKERGRERETIISLQRIWKGSNEVIPGQSLNRLFFKSTDLRFLVQV